MSVGSPNVARPILRSLRDADSDAAIDLIHLLNCYEADLGAERRRDRVAAMRCFEEDSDAARASAGELVVAELAGEIIGYMAISQREGGAYLPDALVPHAYIENLVVAPAHRGAGLGTMMLDYAEAFARRNGLVHIALGAVINNRKAQALYERQGFAPVSIELAKILTR